MARKSIETRDPLAEEKSVAQVASEALDAEEKKEKQKKRRIRRNIKQIVLDKVKIFYRDRTDKSVFEKELPKIEASLDAMENARVKRIKISEDDVIQNFTLEQLQEMIAKKQAN